MDKVGNVSINYDYYTGSDEYSDGNIENEILEYVKNECDMIRILEQENRWPVLYHLSPVRQSIVEWYPIEADADVLEIGAGCGAVTGALCEKAGSVTCVELSKRRSLINANRHKTYKNLNIIVANFNDVQFEKKYDYITLIGVLEYANYFTDAKNPFEAFLKNIKRLLKEDGKLLIAIENKFGLKYWAGHCEDHTGNWFDGLEGYVNTESKVRTFSKKELQKLIQGAGFKDPDFYYPFPDYKFPNVIYSDDFLPKAEDLLCGLEAYDNNRIVIFDENLAFSNIVLAGEFEMFSNSYFVTAQPCNLR